MKTLLISAVIGVMAATFVMDADAQRRLGGGRNMGRQAAPVQKQQTQPPAQQTPQQANPQQAAPAQQPSAAPAASSAARPGAAAAAAKPASPWRGALMGLAAGLGLAALASWLGFGETLTMIMMALLIGLAVFLLIGFVMRRLRGPQPAYQGAGAPGGARFPEQARREPAAMPIERAATSGSVRPGSAMDEFSRGASANYAASAAASGAAAWGVPADFDTAGFLDHAKRYFGRLHSAWDSADLAELQEFTTQEMFTALTHDLHARSGTTRTDGIDIAAKLLGIESTPSDYLASVRFSGTVRVNGENERVDEVWNFSKPVDGKTGWLLAGIQQMS